MCTISVSMITLFTENLSLIVAQNLLPRYKFRLGIQILKQAHREYWLCLTVENVVCCLAFAPQFVFPLRKLFLIRCFEFLLYLLSEFSCLDIGCDPDDGIEHLAMVILLDYVVYLVEGFVAVEMDDNFWWLHPVFLKRFSNFVVDLSSRQSIQRFLQKYLFLRGP